MALLTAGADPALINQLTLSVPGQSSPPTAMVHTEFDGTKVSQRSIVSSRPVSELKSHFAQMFKRAGLYIAPEQEDVKMESGEQVTGLDTENLIAYTALMQTSGKLTTVVLDKSNYVSLEMETDRPYLYYEEHKVKHKGHGRSNGHGRGKGHWKDKD